jgi:DnaJ-domain-containing protein 1
MLAVVEPSNDLDEQVVQEIKSLVAFSKDRFKSESRSFALQAEDALTSVGNPDQEIAEKIKVYVQQVKQAREEEPSQGGGGGGSEEF